MKNTLRYKNYYGSVEFSDDDNVFFGRIIGINDRITYEGNDVNSLRQDFENAVEDYLDTCLHIGKDPEKTYRGIFNVRINPSLHRKLALFSVLNGKTLNAAIEDAIRSYVDL